MHIHLWPGFFGYDVGEVVSEPFHVVRLFEGIEASPKGLNIDVDA